MDEEPRAFWDRRAHLEPARERDYPEKRVHTDLVCREIGRSLAAGKGLRILDAGAGAGRYSVPLAAAGHQVVHLDVSPAMLRLAREAAQGVCGIEFVEGNISDLSGFDTGAFDAVLCLDSPLSFCVHDYEAVLAELCRVAAGPLVLCLKNRTGLIADGINFDLQHYGRLRTALAVETTGTLEVTDEMRQSNPGLFPSWHAFTPTEIRALLEDLGWHIERLSAPGSLARFVNPMLLTRLFADPNAYAEYLEFEERFDADPGVLGLGAFSAGGLLISARPAAVTP